MKHLQGKSVLKQARALAAQCGLSRPWVIVSDRLLGDSHRIRTESVVYALSVVSRSCCDHGKTARNRFIAAKLKRTTIAELKTDSKLSRFPASKPVYEHQLWCLECAKGIVSDLGGTLDWIISG